MRINAIRLPFTIDSLARPNIPATFINASIDSAEQGRRLRALVEGEYKIVLVAPERLRSKPFRDALTQISLLCIDEVHCLSQWGHDFRPDYLHIAEARRDFHVPITLALTATATPRARRHPPTPRPRQRRTHRLPQPHLRSLFHAERRRQTFIPA